MLEFTVLDPTETLKRDVERFRLSTYTSNERLSIKDCPNGRPQIVFQDGQGQPAIENTVTEVTVMNFRGPFTAIQAVMKPYALQSLFGLDAVQLANTSTTLERLCPQAAAARELDQKLVERKDDEERIALLSHLLEGLVTTDHDRDTLVEESI